MCVCIVGWKTAAAQGRRAATFLCVGPHHFLLMLCFCLLTYSLTLCHHLRCFSLFLDSNYYYYFEYYCFSVFISQPLPTNYYILPLLQRVSSLWPSKTLALLAPFHPTRRLAFLSNNCMYHVYICEWVLHRSTQTCLVS